MYFDHWRTDRISGVVESSKGLLVVCVSAAHPFYGAAGCGVHTARLAAHGACACVPLHAEGQVLQVAPHTAILGRWNPPRHG